MQMSLQGNLKWNGLPENYHNDPFGENPAEQTSPDPWGSQVNALARTPPLSLHISSAPVLQ